MKERQRERERKTNTQTNKDVSFQEQCMPVTLQGNMVHSPMLHLTK